ncbi:uncharacterized protein LOC119996929 [Tripterygium wilfordii]|uniref:uncharacterized protein LOC119996929 n=1 Tax=Tripterygium wilfordii TaxID=458696 RepID=UPI0018F8434B|nr:uncharacterized protein LOC119996929 [Tripterygium wilfordii]
MTANQFGVLGSSPNPSSSRHPANSILGSFPNPLLNPISQQINQVQNPFRNPYYLTHSDFTSNLIHLTLTGGNFHLWRNQLETALKARNKMCFVDGSLKAPEENDPSFQDWEQCDNLVKTWINNCLSVDIQISVSTSKTANELWTNLKNRYSSANPTRDFELVRAISTIKQGSSSVTEYYARIKALWDELYQYKRVPSCKCGKCICGMDKVSLEEQNKDRLLQFLMGLNDSFEHVTNQILLMDPLPDVNKAFAQVGQVEK